MIVVLTAVLGAIAAIAWLVVVYSAVRVVTIAPAGKKLAALGLLVRREFAALYRLAGEAIVPHANRFLLAAMAFLGCLACGAALAVVTLMDRLAG
jgi:hypothetical protein